MKWCSSKYARRQFSFCYDPIQKFKNNLCVWSTKRWLDVAAQRVLLRLFIVLTSWQIPPLVSNQIQGSKLNLVYWWVIVLAFCFCTFTFSNIVLMNENERIILNKSSYNWSNVIAILLIETITRYPMNDICFSIHIHLVFCWVVDVK